jgi:hypothetical protein
LTDGAWSKAPKTNTSDEFLEPRKYAEHVKEKRGSGISLSASAYSAVFLKARDQLHLYGG